MSSNQEFIDPLPVDGELWLVKYIDQFHQADGASSSTAVYLLLQRLPPYHPDDVGQIPRCMVSRVLGFRGRSDPRRTFLLKRIFVGHLCAISIGDVYLNGVYVGRLRTETTTFDLSPGEADSVDHTLGEVLEAPADCRSNRKSRILNASEYCGLDNYSEPKVSLKRARVVVLRRRNGHNIDTFVIPRTVIFSTYYACHTLMANAFCAGTWENKLKNVILLNTPDGELATAVAPDTGNWNILLQTNIESHFAGLLAVLYFDEYGRRQANAIHTISLQDRKANTRAPYYASAKIPLQAVNEPLTLGLNCLRLRDRFFQNADGVRCNEKKYLVTGIYGTTWPSHYPTVARYRANSNGAVEDPDVVEKSGPFRGINRTKKSNSSTRIRSDVDAYEDSSTTKIQGAPWSWLNDGPTYIQLEKKHSKRYKSVNPPPHKEEGNEVSTGNRNHEKRSIPKGEASVVSEPDIDSFTAILTAMKKLKDKEVLSVLEIVRARRAGQETVRYTYPCWKIVDEFSLKKGGTPTGGWSTIYELSQDKRVAYWRTALVLSIQFKGFIYHWIEIEARSSDYQSVLLKVRYEDRMKTIEETLSVISSVSGRWLDKHLKEHFREQDVGVSCYKHRKEKPPKSAEPNKNSTFTEKGPAIAKESALSVQYIEAFLNRSTETLNGIAA